MLDEAEVERLRGVFERRDTEELVEIWRENARNQHTDEAFEAIRLVLLSRDIEPPEQMTEAERVEQGRVGGFWSFGTLISGGLIHILYVFGVVGVTGVGILEIADENLAIGLTIILFGNLFLRLAAESAIVLFNIHDLLRSIDRKLT